jgi:rhodanese-related sulfurtransferase
VPSASWRGPRLAWARHQDEAADRDRRPPANEPRTLGRHEEKIMADQDGRDTERGQTLRGVLLIVAVGLALGFAYNAIGRASRPPHGLAWISSPAAVPNLEALEAAGHPPGTSAAPSARPPEPPRAAGSGTAVVPAGPREPQGSAGGGTGRASASPAHGTPAPSGARAGAGTLQAPAAAAAPAPSRTATPAPASAPPAGDVPAIPDVSGPVKLEMATLKKLYDANAALLLDAREADEYAEGHIAGATSLPYNDAMADPDRLKRLDSGGRPIVAYCSGGDCELSMDLAKLLVQAGKRRVLVYEGGYPEWQAAGYPVAKGASPGERP